MTNPFRNLREAHKISQERIFSVYHGIREVLKNVLD